MKISINETKTEEIEYPCLMVDNHGLIILFTAQDTNIVISADSSSYVGYHADNWIMDGLKPFTGSITLSND